MNLNSCEHVDEKLLKEPQNQVDIIAFDNIATELDKQESKLSKIK